MYSWEVSHQRHSSTKLPEEGSREPYSLWMVLDTVPFSGHKHRGSQSLGLWLVLQELSIREAVFFRSLKSSGAGCSSLIMKYVPSTLPAKLNIEPVEIFLILKRNQSIFIELAKRINLELRGIKLEIIHTLGCKAANQSSTKTFVFLRNTERKKGQK